MIAHLDIWQFIGGIGLFLFAMFQLESALGHFAGRSLKAMLMRYTNTPLKGIAVGTSATAFVQSSSLVGLIVLAFVGAGIVSLENALGVIFGANLGTTLTGWVVTTLGFKFDLESVALPLIGIGSLMLVGLRGKLSDLGNLLAALGFLLMGLSLMKESVGSFRDSIELGQMASFAGWQFLLFGVIFTAIVQSSSAAMMVTLAGLYSGVIELPSAAAIAIGADLGTTSTIVIGSLKGAAVKRRVALAHVIFNLTTTVFAFLLISPLLQLVRFLGVTDPLFSLVAFHSLFNFFGILLFLPIIKPFARFLEGRFPTDIQHESLYVSETDSTVPDAAIVAITEETAHIIARVILQNMRVFSPALPAPPGQLPVVALLEEIAINQPFDELYRKNKKLEGEILTFAVKVQAESLDSEQTERLNRLLSSVRHAVHSAKSLRDIRHNLEEFADSPRRNMNAHLDHFRSVMTEFYNEVYRLRTDSEVSPVLQDFANLMNRINAWHDQLHHNIYNDIHRDQLDDSEISSLLNVNRELLNSNMSMAIALQEFYLEEGEVIQQKS